MKRDDFDNCFINLLENNIILKTCYISHNAYWSPALYIQKQYPNASIQIFGEALNM